jgi:hypothetical protein
VNRKTLLPITVATLVIAVFATVYTLWNPRPPALAPSPIPNGYTAFEQAGSLVQKQTSDFATMSQEQLSSLRDANSNALQIARLGLGQKARASIGASLQQREDHFLKLPRLKLTAQAFAAEGRLAEMEQRTNDAARAYLDAARLGINSRRGGLLLDALVGIAIESIGTSQLQKMVPGLDAKTSGQLARELEALDANKESWEQILQNEQYWSRRMSPGFNHRLAELFLHKQLSADRAKAEKRFNAQQTKTRRLVIDLAAHAYELDKAHRPANINDLVPVYLKAVPQDPISGKNMTLTP